MPFLSQNYIKKPLAALLLLALLLPFLPSPKPVQAQTGILDWLQTKLAAIHIPQIGITKQGHLNIGSWCLIGRNCLLNTCFKSENPSLNNSPCVNPFDGLTLKWGGEEVSSQVPLVNEDGLPAIPQIEFLPQCELRIPPPESEETLTTEQKLAQRTACLYLTRLQKAASQQIYLAKKIFNNTDPFSECLFLRNCRSDCSLALGEFTFTVTILDIAALFLPGGAMAVVQKVMNIAKIINQIRTTWQIVRTLLNDW